MFPFLLDIPYKLSRKLLSNNFYLKFKKIFGREKKYCKASTYQDIFRHYSEHIPDPKDKLVLEIGCGVQLYTSIQFLSKGAGQVLLVEPKLSLSEELFSTNLTNFIKETNYPDIQQKISLSNILSFKELDSIPKEYDGKIDIICSHFVLEHFDDLESYFRNIARLLSKDGTAYSFVDLSDHSFHLFDAIPALKWIYQKYPLNHLRYSDAFFNFVNDKRIAVNRILLPQYFEYSRQYGLNYSVETRTANRCYIHADVLKQSNAHLSDDVFVSHFGLNLRKVER